MSNKNKNEKSESLTVIPCLASWYPRASDSNAAATSAGFVLAEVLKYSIPRRAYRSNRSRKVSTV